MFVSSWICQFMGNRYVKWLLLCFFDMYDCLFTECVCLLVLGFVNLWETGVVVVLF